MIKVEIDSIRVSLMSQDRVVVLKDVATDRYLPIWIGPFEAEAIRVELQGVEVTRPLTHDLLKSIIVQLGGSVNQIVISDLRNDTYFARLEVQINGKRVDIDARPSDAIALAVRLKSPIFVDESVMDKAAIHPEEEINTEGQSRLSDGGTIEASDEKGGKDLGIFRDFLETLDLDDLEEN